MYCQEDIVFKNRPPNVISQRVLLEIPFVGWDLYGGINQHIAVTITGLAIRTGYEGGNGERATNQHRLNWDFELITLSDH